MNFSLKKSDEQAFINEIEQLIEFFSEKTEYAIKTVTFQRLEDCQEKYAEIVHNLDPIELESELANNVSMMKEHAYSFKNYLNDDKNALNKLDSVQNENQRNSCDNLTKLINFQKLSDELGFFKLLKMGLISVVLFVITLVFIFVDSFLF